MIKTIHQLPQVLLAYTLIKLWKAEYEQMYKGIKIYRTKLRYGISLGTIIILSTIHTHTTMKHEYGHTKQSLYFGWLYLIIIGLPSISMNILSIILYRLGRPKFHSNYYNRWPENWADKLGNVRR